MKAFRIMIVLGVAAPLLSACAAARVTGAAVGAAGAVVETAANTTSATAGAVLPGGEESRAK